MIYDIYICTYHQICNTLTNSGDGATRKTPHPVAHWRSIVFQNLRRFTMRHPAFHMMSGDLQ